jgi:hypothetical protein
VVWVRGDCQRMPSLSHLWSSTSPLSLHTFVKSDKDLEDQGLSDLRKVPRGKGQRSLTGTAASVALPRLSEATLLQQRSVKPPRSAFGDYTKDASSNCGRTEHSQTDSAMAVTKRLRTLAKSKTRSKMLLSTYPKTAGRAPRVASPLTLGQDERSSLALSSLSWPPGQGTGRTRRRERSASISR